MILSEQKLGIELRKAFDNAKSRIWIAVPFIGSWNLVERITGISWVAKRNIDFRLLTDVSNEQFIDSKTYQKFKQQAECKTLEGLHAKIYIIDDFILLTSANLTGTAFSKRYEIGITLGNDQVVVRTFLKWWNIAKTIDKDWLPSKSDNGAKNEEPEVNNISKLKKLWELPKSPQTGNDFKEYFNTLNFYNNFTSLYEVHAERLLVDLPIYQEVDSFLNYLFHEHPDKPSSEYLEKGNRELTEKGRISELKKYFTQYKNWLADHPTFENHRIDNIKTIKLKLSKSKIDKLKQEDIELVINSLHCMKSLALNRVKFLNQRNNKIEIIIKSWKDLLHNDDTDLPKRMQTCKNNLYSFGKSSISELLAWYYPNQYPIINRNSNSGMKFFGYDIETY